MCLCLFLIITFGPLILPLYQDFQVMDGLVGFVSLKEEECNRERLLEPIRYYISNISVHKLHSLSFSNRYWLLSFVLSLVPFSIQFSYHLLNLAVPRIVRQYSHGRFQILHYIIISRSLLLGSYTVVQQTHRSIVHGT